MRNMDNGNSGERRVIGSRRRRPDAPSAGGRERAEAPGRWEPSGGGSGGGRGMGGMPTGSGGRSGPSLPIGKGCLSGVGGTIGVIIILVLVFSMVICPGGDGTEVSDGNGSSPVPGNGQIAGESADPFVTSYQSTSASQSTAKQGQTWLVMLYQDADDNILEKDICLDLNEAEKAGSTDRVRIVAQMDRFRGAYSGDGNWTGTKRFLLTQDNQLGILTSKEVAQIGEANMSSGQTLIDFATWAIKTYPADKKVLILSDHGMGWPGGWSDPTAGGTGNAATPLEARLGDKLYLNEMESALGQIRAQTGLDKFELIGLDACLMGQLEVYSALEPHARYAVASEETEPSLGWAYTDFLKALNQNPDMDGARLGRLIVESYIEDDQSIADRAGLEDFLSQDSPMQGLFGGYEQVQPQQLAYQIGRDSTLAAIDLNKIKALNASLNQLVFTFQKASQKAIASSRTYAQSYTSVFGSGVQPSYIDLGNLLQIIKQKAGSNEINEAADAVLTAIRQAVIAEKHGTGLPGSTGISIYFPNSQLYQNAVTGAQSYTAIANRFATQSLWDDFLAFHYAGQTFVRNSTQAVMPTRAVKSPAAGGITVSPVTASRKTVAPGQTIKLETNINGDNISYIYLFAGFYDKSSNSVFVADEDYIESGQTREANGIYYPEWGRGAFTLEFDWEPVVFAIDDGKTRVAALFKPESFGRDFTEAVYKVEGTYRYTGSGEQIPAELYFINGILRQVFGFTGDSQASAPREIIPNAGDTFTVSETWLDLDNSGNVLNSVTQEGKTLTFGSKMFTWKTLDAAAGTYMIGFVVEDIDGNRQQVLTRVEVQ